jgi:hypothetical protein
MQALRRLLMLRSSVSVTALDLQCDLILELSFASHSQESISSGAVHRAFQALSEVTQILRLRAEYLSSVDARALFQCLSITRSITTLDLVRSHVYNTCSCADLGNNAIGDAGAEVLGKSLFVDGCFNYLI